MPPYEVRDAAELLLVKFRRPVPAHRQQGVHPPAVGRGTELRSRSGRKEHRQQVPVLRGELDQGPPSRGEDCQDVVERHRGEFVYKYIGAAPTEHLFRAVPSAPDAEVCVEVEDRFGNRYLWSAAQGYSCRLAAEAQAPQAAQSPKRELPKKESLKEPPQEGTAAPHAAE